MLSRSTTWTLGREGNLGLEFAWVNYYDGTGFLVKKSARCGGGERAWTVPRSACSPAPAQNLPSTTYFRMSKMKFTPILINGSVGNRGRFPFRTVRQPIPPMPRRWRRSRFSQGPKGSDDLVLLPDIISKEPLGVMVRKGDDKWFDLVRWTFIAMITAEEKGITMANVDSFMSSTDPDTRRLLGAEGDMGKAMGVDNKWAYNVIKAVGNFGEMWDRNITPMGVPRGINNIWSKGGLQYAPPIR